MSPVGLCVDDLLPSVLHDNADDWAQAKVLTCVPTRPEVASAGCGSAWISCTADDACRPAE